MGSDWYSVEQVAEQLGLHVRTVRNYVREGRLTAVKIGKQYRIARTDLAAFTGAPAVPAAAGKHVEVSSIVQIDGLDRAAADRIGIVLTAGAQGPRDSPGQLRIQTLHDEERSRMKIVILGPPAATADLLLLVDGLLSEDNGLFGSGPEDGR
jgi:excisionase family DNA binding protein